MAATHPRPGLKQRAPADPALIKEEIRAEALRLGFAAVGFAAAEAPALQQERLATFVELQRHGDMAWMAEHLDRRADPGQLWSGARTLISLGLSYAPAGDPLEALADRSRPAISVYARGRDYHLVLKSRLKALGLWMWNRWGRDLKVFVDTAPLMEKPAAMRAGLGWQGKHTNLVSRRHGSWLFLGEILSEIELPPDEPEADHCGTCRACLDICPTDAFPAPGQLDARRCISYLTIEHAGPIAREFRAAMGNRVYGCDDCLAVCPWNKFAQAAHEAAFEPRATGTLVELCAIDDATFRARFSGSAIKRTGRERFVRNIAIALGNSEGGEAAVAAVTRLLDDPSATIRGAAVWALERLSRGRFDAERAVRFSAESDESVRAEWNAGATCGRPVSPCHPERSEGSRADLDPSLRSG
ncbi:MAG: tRNA epoxyqueuosine(34) reductase QueG [Alphaproteobacteria bacterium]|nr:tRNA epoxyqueuosine(34) reductase QueG [Alphaproteobacteria bacterium]MCW5742132.1 tRNA epoxyqueuosine(34) reductase QueG [Alphaproteobacteria bacterium]